MHGYVKLLCSTPYSFFPSILTLQLVRYILLRARLNPCRRDLPPSKQARVTYNNHKWYADESHNPPFLADILSFASLVLPRMGSQAQGRTKNESKKSVLLNSNVSQQQRYQRKPIIIYQKAAVSVFGLTSLNGSSITRFAFRIYSIMFVTPIRPLAKRLYITL